MLFINNGRVMGNFILSGRLDRFTFAPPQGADGHTAL